MIRNHCGYKMNTMKMTKNALIMFQKVRMIWGGWDTLLVKMIIWRDCTYVRLPQPQEQVLGMLWCHFSEGLAITNQFSK